MEENKNLSSNQAALSGCKTQLVRDDILLRDIIDMSSLDF